MIQKPILKFFDALDPRLLKKCNTQFSLKQGPRGDEGEDLFDSWLALHSWSSQLKSESGISNQKAWDRKLTSGRTNNQLHIQVKQRTAPLKLLDGLWPQHRGMADGHILFLTDRTSQQLQEIIMVESIQLFDHPEIYYSEYNGGRGQLTKKRTLEVAHRRIVL